MPQSTATYKQLPLKKPKELAKVKDQNQEKAKIVKKATMVKEEPSKTQLDQETIQEEDDSVAVTPLPQTSSINNDMSGVKTKQTLNNETARKGSKSNGTKSGSVTYRLESDGQEEAERVGED